ncbi:MAG: RNA 3'-terminal phosphate cyclase [Vicinamibacteria bacterium]|jgi:RNA 3'-terminal phosphate cyclase (ATP)|nr:RNA 3'-terminal phosphate cyclase [Vicinamibacteria bacterium]
MLIEIDGGGGTGGAGHFLRAALALSAFTGRGFELRRIRTGCPVSGLRAADVAVVRAVAMACSARIGGVFDGSTDLRFEPKTLAGGECAVDMSHTASVAPVLETLIPLLALTQTDSRIEIHGCTHAPGQPTYHQFATSWIPMVARLGIECRSEIQRAGFWPRGGGRVTTTVTTTQPPSQDAVDWTERGDLVRVIGVAGVGKRKTETAQRAADTVREFLWERLRLESSWEVARFTSSSAGMFLQLTAEFQNSRAGFALLGEHHLRPEIIGGRAARMLLSFLDQPHCVDPFLCDQLLIPLLLSRRGGTISTSALNKEVFLTARVAERFGLTVRVDGKPDGGGTVHVPPIESLDTSVVAPVVAADAVDHQTTSR